MTRAVVIRAMPYGESDLIVTLLTEGHGMLRGIARGGMRSRKRFAGCFEPFTLLMLGCRVRDGGGLAGIDSADILRAYYGIREDLARIEAGARMLELVSAVEVSGTSCGAVFGLLTKALGLLEGASCPAALCGAFFVKYIAASGFRIPYESCSRCGGAFTGKAFYGGGHGLYCPRCRGRGDPLMLSPGCLSFIRAASASGAGMMGRLRLTRPAEEELMGFLKRYVEGVVGKSLKTLDNFS